ncbi:cytochrome P450 CYP82D47-like [Beta vulgaris subsp. vulgaris]|uniref:cytochrome P450 CYP82D47-like n=1 Tax=Beta vulgaris subsp. vulgaris TaxID=3555 RepID=UPI002037626A|nr:cytochrome P450 CYP82D47-like [Beta vulgaris subsp. vulgaris]
MEFQLSTTATSLLALLLFLYCLQKWKKNTDTGEKKPPTPSNSWPIIGHLHLLGSLPHIALGNLADRYGPIFMIQLGVERAVVVSSAEMARECLGAGDKVFLNRPQKIYVEHMAYNSAMLGFTPYGEYWRQIRKITTIELLSNHRVEMFKNVRVSEVRSGINRISGAGSEIVDMKQWFHDISLSTIIRLVSGKSSIEFYQSEVHNQCMEAIRDFFELAGVFVPGDALPFLRWMDIGGYEKKMKRVAKVIDVVAQKWLEEHKERTSSKEKEEKRDFMDVMLGVFETGQNKPFKFDSDTIIKANSMAMILAATDTTAVTLTWALSLLLNNKDVLKKIQAELDNVVGKERQVEESDLKNLVYLQAVLKETMRLYPAAPLSAPREATIDCTVSGYHISAGTQLFVNLYKIHRDPKVWENPLDFHPERFLTTNKDYDVRGQSFEYMPFGSGRRICPGISFALLAMQFTLASLLHGFDISIPSDETVDMSESFGLTNLKATPLEVIATHRLPHLYSDPNMTAN